MSSPELIDERYSEIVRELRALPGAPERVHEYVRKVAANEPAPRRRLLPRLTLRQTGFALAGAAASLVAVSLVYGLVSSGGPGGKTAAPTRSSAAGVKAAQPAQTAVAGGGAVRAPATTTALQTSTVAALGDEAAPTAAPPPPSKKTFSTAPVNLPPANGRLQKYTASMRLRVESVDDLSKATARAMRITRALGGYVVAVKFGTPGAERGTASLKLRVPAGNVQRAIVRLSALGTILSQQISISDLQDTVNRESAEIARLGRTIARLEDALKKPVSEADRIRLQTQLDGARATLRALAEGRASTVRKGRLATLSLAMTTKQAAAAKPKSHHSGRIERAARNAARFLTWVGAIAVYALIVLSPLLVLGAAALAGSRFRRRRFHQRLLEQA